MGKEINSFLPEIQRVLDYYVYKLIDPRDGKVFYIGRGKDNRIFDHVAGTNAKFLQIYKELGEESQENNELDHIFSLKEKTIYEIHSKGLKVTQIIHRHGLTLDQAKEVEAALLDDYNGITNIKGGYGSIERGPMSVNDIIQKYRLDEVEFSEEDKLILINIKNSIKENTSIYDATRYAWVVNIKRANNAEYIISHSSGIILDVFNLDKVKGWQEALSSNFNHFPFPDLEGRKAFQQGTEVDETIKTRFLGKRLPSIYNDQLLSGQNPIKYINI
jgi:hypothetical protein